MQPERLDERSEPRLLERQDALGPQLVRERGSPVAVCRVIGLVLTSRVVEEAEAEHEGWVDTVLLGPERVTGRRDAPPVRLAVPGGVASPRAWQHGLHEPGQRPRFHSLTIAHCAEV